MVGDGLDQRRCFRVVVFFADCQYHKYKIIFEFGSPSIILLLILPIIGCWKCFWLLMDLIKCYVLGISL